MAETDSMASQPDPMDAYALAVGQLCNEWAGLELTVCWFVARLARIPRSYASDAMMRGYAFKDHLSAIKIGAVATSQNIAWVEAVTATVDYIDNTLRNRRNRFVHDQWGRIMTEEPGVILISHDPKVTKPQAFQPRKLIHATMQRRHSSEITETTREIREHRSYLGALIDGLDLTENEPLPEPLATPPQRRFLHPQSGTRDPSGKPKPKRQRPPRSSRRKPPS